MSKTIIIKHSKKTGKSEITASGYAGDSCRTATAPFIDAISRNVISDTPTPEATLSNYGDTNVEQENAEIKNQ